MAPKSKAPRSAYHFYVRFRKNIFQCPSLGLNYVEMNEGNKDLSKNFVKAVLDAKPVGEKMDHQKYIGNESFTSMSKKLGMEWKAADKLTRSIFQELAKEDRTRYKKELYDSYQTFTKNHPAPMPASHLKQCGRPATIRREVSDETQAKGKADIELQSNKETHAKEDNHQERNSPRPSMNSTKGEVDMKDEEILSLARRSWGLSPPCKDTAATRDVFVSPDDIGRFLFGSLCWD